MKHIIPILIIILLIVIFLLTGCAGIEKKTDCKIDFFGIRAEHFQDRNWWEVGLGWVGSFIVHEGSHILHAELNGGGHIDFSQIPIVCIMEDLSHSHSTKQWFHRAGFIGQLVVGGILTAIPATRHSDITLGFNSFTTANTGIYVITGGVNNSCSDIAHLDHGTAEGIAYTGVAGVLTYINLKKPLE